MARWKTHELEKLFDNLQLFDLKSGLPELAADVYEEGNNIVVKMTIPGVEPEDIDITVEKNYIRVVGDREEEEVVEGRNYLAKEIRRGSFERLIDLHAEVDPDKSEADYSNGVLTLTLPKASVKEGKKVKVAKKKK